MFGRLTLYMTEPMTGALIVPLTLLMNIQGRIDEYTREALMIRVDRKLNSTDVVDALIPIPRNSDSAGIPKSVIL